MKKILIFAALIPSITNAEPSYLDCKVSSDTDQKEFSLKLDEDSGKITHTGNRGTAFNTEGFFAANKVSYQKVTFIRREAKVTYKYEINRTNLNVKEVFILEAIDPKMAEKFPSTTTIMNGSCQLLEVQERKI